MSQEFMRRALEVSKNALPECQPNPPVGCVLVKDNQIVSEGHTQAIGGNHAEVEAECVSRLVRIGDGIRYAGTVFVCWSHASLRGDISQIRHKQSRRSHIGPRPAQQWSRYRDSKTSRYRGRNGFVRRGSQRVSYPLPRQSLSQALRCTMVPVYVVNEVRQN